MFKPNLSEEPGSSSSRASNDAISSVYRFNNPNSNTVLSVLNYLFRFFKWIWSQGFAISCIIFVLMDVMTTVFYKRLIDHSRNYVMFSIQLIIGTFWFFVTLLSLLCFLFKKDYMKRHFDPKPLFFLGFLDMLSTGLSANGSTHTSGLMLVLLGQISVPLTMVACKLFLSKKYHIYQYVSSVIILFFAILKPLINREDTSDNRFYNNVLYLVSGIPDSIASALREKQYTSKFFHVMKYQFFGFMFHFFYNIIYTMATAVPFTGFFDYFRGLFDLYVNGFNCVFYGVNSIVENCGPKMVPTCDNCRDALKIYLLYILFSSVIRIAYVYIMLDGSVTFTLLLGTVKVPLTSIAFSLHFIAGDSTTNISFIDVLCFLGIVSGLLLYALGSRKMQEEANLLQSPLLDEEPEDLEMDPLLTKKEHLVHSETSEDIFT